MRIQFLGAVQTVTGSKYLIQTNRIKLLMDSGPFHHPRHFAPNHKNNILFSGFQVAGTRGDRMLRGEREIKMFGQMIPIRAETAQVENISEHADSTEMHNWFGAQKKSPHKVFITHGETEAALTLKAKIEQQFHWKWDIPSYLDSAIFMRGF